MWQKRCLLQKALRVKVTPPALAFEVTCSPVLRVGLWMEKALWLFEPLPFWSAYAGERVGRQMPAARTPRVSRHVVRSLSPAAPVVPRMGGPFGWRPSAHGGHRVHPHTYP